MSNQLDALAQLTVLVADTGDINSIKQFKPTDATTNPSLLLKAAEIPAYASLVDDAVHYGIKHGNESNRMTLILDKLAVNFGKEITKIVPGYVSTEVDARLSYDEEATYQRAKQIIALYKSVGVPKDRILIKIASTWEGIQAAKRLEKEGITCNMTLLFGFCQAVACAEAGATLISPFVGRIFDWYCIQDPSKKEHWLQNPRTDPGVQSVTKIYNYYKQIGCPTVVMGASFRNTGQILSLAGCDKLTVSPKLLKQLQETKAPVERVLKPVPRSHEDRSKALTLSEQEFRWQLSEDAMATEKLSQGIRNFAKDTRKLEAKLTARVGSLFLKSKL